MLDNVEGAMKHRQSRETNNLGYTRHRTKTYKTKTIIQYVLDTTIHKTQMTTNKTNNTTLYELDTTIHKTQTTTNKTNNTTLYVLDTTIHKTQDDDKQDK